MPKIDRSLVFERLKKVIGSDLALFCVCAVYDIPYFENLQNENYSAYEEEALELDKSLGFKDGTIDVNIALTKSLPRMEKWKRVWGVGDEEKPYTESDYNRLDTLFRTYSERLVKAGGMDAQQEDTIRACCKMRLLADKCLASGTKDGVEMNTKLNKTIQDNLSAENLRKKDIKQNEDVRVDTIVDLLKRKYGKGASLSLDEAVEMCSKWLVSHKYKVTMDAAEHMLHAIINTMRINSDLPELDALPETAKFDPALASEFATEPTAAELEAYQYLGIERRDGK